MIERIIENWLINASEKAFQIPFCQVLIHEGYTVVHMTRHCSMEMGKDIIAIAPDKTPIAFQLKATGRKKVTKDMWRRDLHPQVNELVSQAIDHPAIDARIPHRSVLVINGEIEEEAQVSIRQYNTGLQANGISGNKQLEVLVRGQLLDRFMKLAQNMIPSELKDEKSLLELYLMKGDDTFPKATFAEILESILLLPDNRTKEAQARAITAASIVSALSLSAFSQKSNHVACFEAWTLYCAYILCLAEKERLGKKHWERAFLLGLDAIRESLEHLADELLSTADYVVGDRMADVPFYRIRITHLVGLMSLLALWSGNEDRVSKNADRYVRKNLANMVLWGEYSIPQFLAVYFHPNRLALTLNPATFLYRILSNIVSIKTDKRGLCFPGPEVDPEEFILDTHIRRKNERKGNYNGGSFVIEGLLHLHVRYNLRQHATCLWPSLSKVKQESFIPTERSDYYRWNIRKGHTHSTFPQPTQSWSKLREDARECSGEQLPVLLRKYPQFYLAFLMVFPHRISSNGLRWLDKKMDQLLD